MEQKRYYRYTCDYVYRYYVSIIQFYAFVRNINLPWFSTSVSVKYTYEYDTENAQEGGISTATKAKI